MTEVLAREEYIEREFIKWKENFVIPFEKEFLVKAVLYLQHQFQSLPEEYVKAKADVLATIKRTMHDLGLKPLHETQQESTHQGVTNIAFVNGGASKTHLNIFNFEEGVIKYTNKYSGRVKDQILCFLNIVDKYRPEKIIFDKRGIGEALYERFIEDAKSAGITVKENGLVIY